MLQRWLFSTSVSMIAGIVYVFTMGIASALMNFLEPICYLDFETGSFLLAIICSLFTALLVGKSLVEKAVFFITGPLVSISAFYITMLIHTMFSYAGFH